MVISQHTQKRVIGFENPTFEVRDDDPDDVGVDQALNLRFALCKIAVQAGIFERDRGLRGEQRQRRDAGRCEDTSGQVVLQIEHADELRLIDQWKAENGTGHVLTNVWILSKRGLGRGIVENDGLLHAQDIVEHRFWQQILGYDIVTQDSRSPDRHWSSLPL